MRRSLELLCTHTPSVHHVHHATTALNRSYMKSWTRTEILQKKSKSWDKGKGHCNISNRVACWWSVVIYYRYHSFKKVHTRWGSHCVHLSLSLCILAHSLSLSAFLSLELKLANLDALVVLLESSHGNSNEWTAMECRSSLLYLGGKKALTQISKSV